MKKNQKSAAEYSQKVTQTAKRYAAPALVIASLGLGSCSKKDDQPPKIHELETSITSREGDATTYKELDTFWTSDNETGTPITNITTSADLEGVLALDATGGNNYTVQQNGKLADGWYKITVTDDEGNMTERTVNVDATPNPTDPTDPDTGTMTMFDFDEITPAGTAVGELRKADGTLDATATVTGEAGMYNDNGTLKIASALDGTSATGADYETGDKLTGSGTLTDGSAFTYAKLPNDVFEAPPTVSLTQNTDWDGTTETIYGQTSQPQTLGTVTIGTLPSGMTMADITASFSGDPHLTMTQNGNQLSINLDGGISEYPDYDDGDLTLGGTITLTETANGNVLGTLPLAADPVQNVTPDGDQHTYTPLNWLNGQDVFANGNAIWQQRHTQPTEDGIATASPTTDTTTQYIHPTGNLITKKWSEINNELDALKVGYSVIAQIEAQWQAYPMAYDLSSGDWVDTSSSVPTTGIGTMSGVSIDVWDLCSVMHYMQQCLEREGYPYSNPAQWLSINDDGGGTNNPYYTPQYHNSLKNFLKYLKQAAASGTVSEADIREAAHAAVHQGLGN